MKNILLIILVLFSVSSFAQTKQLVWFDEFDTDGLPDSEKWGYDVGGGGWGNNEAQYYTDARSENARVQNGVLIIEALKESYGGKSYTSARLITKNKGDWKYGRIEVKAKLPQGRGTWPAIWMLPTVWDYGNGSWPDNGEIDIMEHVGYDPGTVHGTIHCNAYNHPDGTQKGGTLTVNDFNTAFHVYAIEWFNDHMDFYIDDTKYFIFTNGGSWEEWPFDKAFHLILNIAIGGAWGGVEGIDDAIFPQRMTVDYVRVYQITEEIKIVGEEYVKKNGTANQYSVNQVDEATYNWQIPADATITAGQSTNQITVDWGETDGNISCEVNVNGQIVSDNIDVVYTNTPDADIYEIYSSANNDLTGWLGVNDATNSITFTNENNSLKLNLDIEDPDDWPYAIYSFERPLDMSENSFLFIDTRVATDSRNINFRIDLIDVYGNETNGGDLFKENIIAKSDNFTLYRHNFDGDWKSISPVIATVDKTKIAAVKIFLNYGIFGSDNLQDNVFIEQLSAVNPLAVGFETPNNQRVIEVYPNPAGSVIYFNADDNWLSETATLKMYNLQGQLCHTTEIKQGETSCNIDRSKINSGIYLYSITNSKNSYYGKIVFE